MLSCLPGAPKGPLAEAIAAYAIAPPSSASPQQASYHCSHHWPRSCITVQHIRTCHPDFIYPFSNLQRPSTLAGRLLASAARKLRCSSITRHSTAMAAISPTIKGDKLICLGKTYLLHAKELGDAVPDRPVLFLKPPSAAVYAAKQNAEVPMELVKGKGDVHYEAEVVLRLNEALQVDAVTLGLDLTLRDLQAKLKKDGHPWEIAKAFPNSAVVGPWVDVQSFPDYRETEFTFSIDGQEKQRGALKQMMYSTDDAIAIVRDSFTLVPGDVIFTGTPHGVGVVQRGQQGRLQWGDRLSYDVMFQ